MFSPHYPPTLPRPKAASNFFPPPLPGAPPDPFCLLLFPFGVSEGGPPRLVLQVCFTNCDNVAIPNIKMTTWYVTSYFFGAAAPPAFLFSAFTSPSFYHQTFRVTQPPPPFVLLNPRTPKSPARRRGVEIIPCALLFSRPVVVSSPPLLLKIISIV